MRRTPFAHICLLVAFLFNSLGLIPVSAQVIDLPKPGVMVHLSPSMNLPILKGIKVHPDNPFRFDFILDVGNGLKPFPTDMKDESTKLIKYFLASLTIPEKDLWVNLSPYEKDRIVPESFGVTEMGRDLLAQDYMLKQITASLIYPEDKIGKKFWKRIYAEAQAKYHTTNIPVNTFNKVWIVPEKAVVYENGKAGTAYVVESKLKVMLEQDYLSLEKHAKQDGLGIAEWEDPRRAEGPMKIAPSQPADTSALGSQIVREIVIPELTKEVNEGKNFAQLRQVYNSLILATWYKKKIKDSLLSKAYVDKSKVFGVRYSSSRASSSSTNPGSPTEAFGDDKEIIYQQYLQAFKKGVYNYIKEEADPLTNQMTPRKYFSGGFSAAHFGDMAMTTSSDESRLPQHLDGAEEVSVNLAPYKDKIPLEDALNRGLVQEPSIDEYTQGSAMYHAWFDDRVLEISSHIEYLKSLETVAVSKFAANLSLYKNNDSEGVLKRIEHALNEGQNIIIELGAGNTQNALALAKRNPKSLVIAIDLYDSDPTRAAPEYLRYGQDFEANELPAQKSGLDNLLVLRSLADILLYVPDASLDALVFVQPTSTLLKDLIVMVKEFNLLSKFKPSANIGIVANDNVTVQLGLMSDKIQFIKQKDHKFLGVDLADHSDWKEEYLQGGLYLAQVDQAMATPGLKPSHDTLILNRLIKEESEDLDLLTYAQIKAKYAMSVSTQYISKYLKAHWGDRVRGKKPSIEADVLLSWARRNPAKARDWERLTIQRFLKLTMARRTIANYLAAWRSVDKAQVSLESVSPIQASKSVEDAAMIVTEDSAIKVDSSQGDAVIRQMSFKSDDALELLFKHLQEYKAQQGIPSEVGRIGVDGKHIYSPIVPDYQNSWGLRRGDLGENKSDQMILWAYQGGVMFGYGDERNDWQGYGFFSLREGHTLNLRFRIFDDFRGKGKSKKMLSFLEKILTEFLNADKLVFTLIYDDEKKQGSELRSALEALGFRQGDNSNEMVYNIPPNKAMRFSADAAMSSRVDRLLYERSLELEKDSLGSILRRAEKGGIDFTADKTPLEIKNAGEEIKFHLDAAQLAQLQNAQGFVPVIINIQPMTDLRAFLGIAK